MQTDNTKRTITAVVVASLIGVAGLTTAGIGLMWVAGTLGVSTAAASQIVSAIEAGGWALAVVMAVFGRRRYRRDRRHGTGDARADGEVSGRRLSHRLSRQLPPGQARQHRLLAGLTAFLAC